MPTYVRGMTLVCPRQRVRIVSCQDDDAQDKMDAEEARREHPVSLPANRNDEELAGNCNPA